MVFNFTYQLYLLLSLQNVVKSYYTTHRFQKTDVSDSLSMVADVFSMALFSLWLCSSLIVFIALLLSMHSQGIPLLVLQNYILTHTIIHVSILSMLIVIPVHLPNEQCAIQNPFYILICHVNIPDRVTVSG